MTTPKKTNSPADKKIFDVAKPGKSAPTASGKPIIITNRPILKDPMVVDKSGQDTATATPLAPSKPSTRIKISPLDDALKEELATPTSTDEGEVPAEKSDAELTPAAVEEGATIPTESEVTATPEVKTETTEVPPAAEATDAPAPSESAEPAANEAPAEKPAEDTTPATEEQPTAAAEEAVATEAAPADNTTTEGDAQKPLSKADEEAARKEAERQAELQKLIDSKKFYLPIDRKGKRRTKWHVALGVIFIVVLAVAWVDIALDSGMVHVAGVKSYTHFFSK